MADRWERPPGGTDSRDPAEFDPAEFDPAFGHDFEQSLDPVPPAGRRRRFRLPLAAAAIMVAALVGGAMAGIIFRLRDDGTAVDPTPSPSATMIAASSDPSASARPAVTMAPTGTPLASSSAEASETPTTAPAPTASAAPEPASTPVPTRRATASPPPSPRGVEMGWTEAARVEDVASMGAHATVVGRDGRLYAFLAPASNYIGDPEGPARILVFDPEIDSVEVREADFPVMGGDIEGAAGADGLIYLFAWGPESTRVWVYDPATNSDAQGGYVDFPVPHAFDVASGPDGTIYLLEAVNFEARIHRYDPETQAATLVVDLDWHTHAMVADPDGRLVLAGRDGVGIYDPSDDSWQTTPATGLGLTWYVMSEAAGADGQVLLGDYENQYLHFDEGRWAAAQPPGHVGGTLDFVDGRWVSIGTLERGEAREPSTFVISVSDPS